MTKSQLNQNRKGKLASESVKRRNSGQSKKQEEYSEYVPQAVREFKPSESCDPSSGCLHSIGWNSKPSEKADEEQGIKQYLLMEC